MKYLLVLFAVIFGAFSQTVPPACHYWMHRNTYVCSFSIQNPNGQEFAQITGTHLDGRSNNDVTDIRGSSRQHTTNIPLVICLQFPNLQHLDLFEFGITAITDLSLRCENLQTLNLFGNRITTIGENVFEFVPFLRIIHLGNNPILSMSAGSFRNLINMEMFDVQNTNLTTINPSWFAAMRHLRFTNFEFNQIAEIPANTFGQNNFLEHIMLSNNKINSISRDAFGYLGNVWFIDLGENGMNAVDARIFDARSNIDHFQFTNNICANGTFLYVSQNREQFNEAMQQCFANYQ